MTEDVRRTGCLDANMMAEYIDGGLDPRERAEVEAHLAECEACYEVFGETVRMSSAAVSPSAVASTAPQRRSTHRLWRLSVAAAALLAVSVVVWQVVRSWPGTTSRPELTALVKAVGTERRIEARLTGGFAWGERVAAQRGSDTPTPAVTIAAAELQQAVERDRSATHLAAFGSGQIALGHLDAAISALQEAIAVAPPRAEWWSDLSAALLARAAKSDASMDVPAGLEAAEEALRLAPTLGEALFNRALALESLGLTVQAEAAWESYLRQEHDPLWIAEARARLDRLRAKKTTRRDLQPDRDRLFDRDLPSALLTAAPAWSSLEAGLGEILRHPDQLPADVIAATKGRPDRAAHELYATARTRYRAGDYAGASSAFAQAGLALQRSANPLALAADGYRASAEYMLGHFDDARRLLERTLARVPDTYASVRGRANWVLGLIAANEGRNIVSRQHYEDARMAFQRADEFENTAFMSSLLAEEADSAGNGARAWTLRLAAMREGRRPDTFLSAAWSARAASWPLAAIAFQQEAVAIARARQLDRALADGLRELALSLHAEQRDTEAAAALTEARRALQLTPTTPATRVSAELDLAESQCATRESAATAITAANRALAFYESSGARGRLADVLLARSRAWRLSNDAGRARDDIAAGLQLLRQEAAASTTASLHAALGDRIRLFSDELVAIEIARACWECALEAAEAGRQHEATATLPITALLPQVPGDVAIRYFWVGDGRLVQWVIRRGRVDATARTISEIDLSRLVAAFNRDLSSADLGRQLADVVLGPAPAEDVESRVLVVVPDASLHTVPFGALPGTTQRYLADQQPILVATSLTNLVQQSPPRLRRPRLNDRVTLIGNPEIDRTHYPALPNLAGAAEEVERIRQVYSAANVRVLTGKGATAAAVVDALGAGGIVHFAGHALIDGRDPDRSRLVVASADGDGLTAAQLMRVDGRAVRLIVLAACDSGGGPVTREDGSLGLARALERSGAGAIVASLWPVNDASAVEFFTQFHEAYARSGDAVAALRHAQRALMTSATERFRRPDAWAGFFVVGSIARATGASS